jgi:hypothetical protein
MKRFVCCAAALLLSSLMVASPARADRGFGGFHEGRRVDHDRRFDRDRFFFRNHVFFRDRFFFRSHFFFRPFFFFRTPVFAPVPFALSPALPNPAYFMAPAAGAGACYQFQTTLPLDGQNQPAWGTACLQPDGT